MNTRNLRLNAFEILGVESLKWKTRILKLSHLEKKELGMIDIADLKSAGWELLKKYKERCRGERYVICTNPNEIVIPEGCDIQEKSSVGSYFVEKVTTKLIEAIDFKNWKIVSELIKEGIKKHLKNNKSERIGDLWQDYDKFCQRPFLNSEIDNLVCKKFGFSAKKLRENKWVLQIIISSTIIDRNSFESYINKGKIWELIEKIENKTFSGVDRQNRQLTPRVLHFLDSAEQLIIKPLDFCGDEKLNKLGKLAIQEIIHLKDIKFKCNAFQREPEEIPSNQIHLILNSQIASEEQRETILSPEERYTLQGEFRDFINGISIFNANLELSSKHFEINKLECGIILPPKIRLKDQKTQSQIVIDSPNSASVEALRSRTKMRMDYIKKNGFLEQREINPLLAFPEALEKRAEGAAKRMKNSLNQILSRFGVPYEFKSYVYRDVEELRKFIEKGEFNTLLAVLAENKYTGSNPSDIHELIKQRIEVPSQCILEKNILPLKYVNISSDELKKLDSKLVSRISKKYELVVLNLLVKHNCIPFAPAERFNYNVHLGIDVGGTHNTEAMSCFGYGFTDPQYGLFFRPDSIPIMVQKKEPIPTESLFNGLLRQFETVRTELLEVGFPVDFDSAIFFRDGRLAGDGDSWNELDALKKLAEKLFEKGWISSKAKWCAVEVLKQAEDWRIFSNSSNGIENPLAGTYCLPYDLDSRILLCSTGSPFLTQGTAAPLMVNFIDVIGENSPSDVLKDLLWETDMCFTKPDTGMKLPWVLHVADAGALQLSRSYKITGITA